MSTFFGVAMAIEGSSGWCVCSERDDPDLSEDFESSCRRRFITCSDTPPPEISLLILIAGSFVVLGAGGSTAGSVVGGEGWSRGSEAATTRCHSVLLPSCSSNLERSALF